MGAMDHDEPRMPLWMLLSLCAAAALAATCAAPKAAPPPPPVFIAHAGGIGNHQTYTNSLEALDRSVDRGFQAIEIDFSLITSREECLWRSFDRLVLRQGSLS
jgi:hypothetical protein